MEKICIYVPTLNEEDIIETTIVMLLGICDRAPEYQWEIIIVDNGSTDTTAEKVKKLSDVRVGLLQLQIRGKGKALSHAAKKCDGDILGYIDADLSAEPHHILDFIKEIKDGTDIVTGSRLLEYGKVNRSIWRTITAILFKTYADILVPVPVTDSQCGLKLMNRKGIEVLGSCEDMGWLFDREFLAKANKRNLRIKELPVVWEEFRYPNRKSKLSVFRDGLKSLYQLWKIRSIVKKFK